MFGFASGRSALAALAGLVIVAAGAAFGLVQPASSSPPPVIRGSSASCVGLTRAQEFRAARVVLVGVMLPGPSVRAGGHGELLSPARVRVVRYLKGHGPSRVRVQTATRRSGTGYVSNSEGIDPRAGQRWKIYSTSDRRPYPTSVCDGSRRLSG